MELDHVIVREQEGSRGTLMKKSYHYSRWVEGIIINTEKLVCSLENVAEIFYEHLIFNRLKLLKKQGVG